MSREEFLHYLKFGLLGWRIGALGTGLPFALFIVLPWLFQFCLHTFDVFIHPGLLAAVWMCSCPFEAALGNVIRGKRLDDTIDMKADPHATWCLVMFVPFVCLPFAGPDSLFHVFNVCRALSAVFLFFGATLFVAGFIGKWMEEKGVKL